MSTEAPSGDPDTSRRPHPLTAEVLRLVSSVRTIALEDGEEGTVEALDAELARTRQGAARVVVVGEKKRGKSTLANALVGRPGLLPVDADIASCVHVVLGAGPELLVRVHDRTTPEGREVPASELAVHAGLDPDTGEQRTTGITEIEVLVPSPLLDTGLELVDTPGVGGLVDGHAALALATLDRADALLFVLDGQGEVSASELAFLERATERVATVLFAVTKIDQHPGWQTVVSRDLALIGEHAPRWADAAWFPVSARSRELADRDLARGRPEKAAQRLAVSGLPELEGHLARVAEGAEGLRLVNLVHQADLGAKRLAALQVRRAKALTLDPTFARRLAEQKEALTELQGRSASWRQALAERSVRIEQGLKTELARRIEDLRKECNDQIVSSGRGVADALAADLPARAQALWLELDGMLRRDLPSLVEAVAGVLAESDIDLDTVMPGEMPSRVEQLPGVSRGKPTTNIVEQTVMAMGLGSMTTTLVSLAIGPVGVVAGVAVVGVFAHRRWQRERLTRDREDARRYLNEVCVRLGNELPPALSQVMLAAKEAVATRVAESLAVERARLTASLAEHEKSLAAEKSALQKRRNESDRRLRERDELRQRAAGLADRLRLAGGEGC